MKRFNILSLSMIFISALSSCKNTNIVGDTNQVENDEGVSDISTETYRGFTLDHVLTSSLGDIHYNLYVPDSYEGKEPFALFVTLSGYEGLYRFGVGANLQEDFAFQAMEYNEKMIILAPQLDDWGRNSALETIQLTNYMLETYKIDTEKVYLEGYSGGGETLSLVMEESPELYVACLHVSSQWDGDLQPFIEAMIPTYMVIGEDDEYYGSSRISHTFTQMAELYREKGLTEEEINQLIILDIKNQSYFDAIGISNQHGGGNFIAFDEEIMTWLFSH